MIFIKQISRPLAVAAGLLISTMSTPSSLAEENKAPLENIESVKKFREETGMDIGFEIAGQNIPEEYQRYRIGPGDEMEVLVERFEPLEASERFEISSDYIQKFASIVYTRYKVTVDPMGNIQIPLIGELRAAGYSREEVETEVKENLGRYLVNPKVFVKVSGYTSFSISVLGKVHKPGRYEIKRPVRLSEAIALAGGLTSEGTLGKVYVARQTGSATKFNITEVWTKKGIREDMVLGRDDIVYVPHKLWITWTTAQQIATVVDLLTNAYFRYKENTPL